MYRHILIATDGSELAGKALDHGLALAKGVGAKVTLLHVTEPFPVVMSEEAILANPIEDYDKAVVASAEKILGRASEAAAKAGVTATARHEKNQYPAEGIVKAAGAVGADLIVMASHGRRGISKLLLGSQATEVLTHSKIPVLVCR